MAKIKTTMYQSQNIYDGIEIIKRVEPVGFKKRFCYHALKRYIFEDNSGKVCALYGLRRTGKTILM